MTLIQKLSKDKHSLDHILSFVKDRPGHDRRYSIDFKKIKNNLGWAPKFKFKDALEETVKWYLDNQKWAEKFLIGPITILKELG